MKIRIAALSICWLHVITSLSSFAASDDKITPLPRFDIFGLTPKDETEYLKLPHSLESVTSELEKLSKPMDLNQTPGKEPASTALYCTSCIPIVLVHLRPLYQQTSWTSEQLKLIGKVTATVALIASQPDLAMPVTDDESARACLARLSTWFRIYSNKNENLAKLLFPLDSGPFYGTSVSVSDLAKMQRIATRIVPGRAANFAVWRDKVSRGQEPMVIGVVGHDRKLRWARRFSGGDEGQALSLTPPGNPEIYPDYGLMFESTVKFESRTEKSSIYLDQNLNFRFYRLTWSY